MIISVLISRIYGLASLLLLLYGINCYVLIFLSKPRETAPPDFSSFDGLWPCVTVQLPLFNEKNVAERIIRAVAAFDYPRDKLEIQICDDSNDETVPLIDRLVADLTDQGIDIKVLRRSHRQGYKAGALACGMLQARGDFLAIFDADFVPGTDFLKRTLPIIFDDVRVAFVQTRWGHLNLRTHLLTYCQAMGIDGHFLVEQPGRANGNLLLNFNGTCGLWRKQAIEEAGGWTSDTLTEDLDLSYRVQLAGWKARYCKDVIVPGEIPASMTAVKSQQYRWAKGSIQTAKKTLRNVWGSPLNLFQKCESTLHLTNYLVHPMMLILALLIFPILQFQLINISPWVFAVAILPILAAMLGPSSMYLLAASRNKENRSDVLRWLPLLLIYGIGVAVSNTIAVMEALVGKDSPFIRTPKRGQETNSGYRLRKNKTWALEVLLGLYSVASIAAGLKTGNYGILPFLILFAAGFLTVGIRTVSGISKDA